MCVLICGYMMIVQIKEQYEGAAIEKGGDYNADPGGLRTGNGPGPQLSETIESVCKDVEDALSAVFNISIHTYIYTCLRITLHIYNILISNFLFLYFKNSI